MTANAPEQRPVQGNLRTAWREFAGGAAAGTIGLGLVNLVVAIAVWVLAVRGDISLSAGSAVATINIYLMYTVIHEAAHGNIDGGDRRFARLEETFGWIGSALLLFPYPAFRAIHFRDHANPNDPEKDPDNWVAGSNALDVLFRCLTVSLVYHALMLRTDSRSIRKARPAYFIGMFVLGALLTTTWMAGLFWYALMLWIVPALLAGTVLALLFAWLPHHPHGDQGRMTSSCILLLPLITFPLMGQNYHLLHHLYPRVPFYRYARCFQTVRPLLESDGAAIEGIPDGLPLPHHVALEMLRT